jgi:hypothetical protein
VVDVFFDGICRIVAMCRDAEYRSLTSSDIERRQQLTQVYIVLLGLVLNYGKGSVPSYLLLSCFGVFMIVAAGYLAFVSKCSNAFERRRLNWSAIGIALTFDVIFILCYVYSFDIYALCVSLSPSLGIFSWLCYVLYWILVLGLFYCLFNFILITLMI